MLKIAEALELYDGSQSLPVIAVGNPAALELHAAHEVCDRCLKILQHLSSSNLPSLVLDSHLEKLISLSATRSINQADVDSPCWKNLGSLNELSREVIRVAYAPSIYVYCLPFGYRCLEF